MDAWVNQRHSDFFEALFQDHADLLRESQVVLTFLAAVELVLGDAANEFKELDVFEFVVICFL